METIDALKVFDGLMLGDAGLRIPNGGVNAFFDIALSGKRLGISSRKLITYLNHIAEVLSVLGIRPCTGHPKVFIRKDASGDEYEYCDLCTRTHSFITTQFYRWYIKNPNVKVKEKIVPPDLILSRLSLAYMYMCDGSVSFEKHNWGLYPRVKIATNCFSVEDIENLEYQLSAFGVDVRREKYHPKTIGAGIRLVIKPASIARFVSLVEPYIIEPYRYRIEGLCSISATSH